MSHIFSRKLPYLFSLSVQQTNGFLLNVVVLALQLEQLSEQLFLCWRNFSAKVLLLEHKVHFIFSGVILFMPPKTITLGQLIENRLWLVLVNWVQL